MAHTSQVMDLTAVEGFLRERLAAGLPGPQAQLRFAPRPVRKGWKPHLQPESARQAAALILLYPGPDGVRVPLTVRHDDLLHHAGQVSLPGGRVDPTERPEDAALREAYEEIGIDPRGVRLIGALSPLWVLVSNFVVRPFVGIADERPAFRLAPMEVTAVLETPLETVFDASRVGWTTRTRDGIVVSYPHFELAGHQVWGATAMMLGEFASLFAPEFAPPPFS